jgi:tight adherence protein B
VNTAVAYPLAAASLLLVLLCVSGLALRHADQRHGRFRMRVAQYASSYARATAIVSREEMHATASVDGRRALRRLMAWLVGFDASRQDDYLLPWWLVLPTALLLARGIVGLAQTLFGGAALLAMPVICILFIRRFYRWCDQRRLRALYEQFPDTLAMLVRAVRVGIPITEGFRNVAAESADPTGREFKLLVDQIAVGVTLPEALHGLATRNPVPEYRFFTTALALQSETGGAVSETLERLAEVIRKRVALREHARALASEARTSIAILAALPVFAGGALALLSPDYVSTLFTDPQGRRIFTLAIISLTAGIVTMRTVVSRSLS